MIRVGASGYSFPDWEGVAYPKGDRASRRLVHYASTGLDFVEVQALPLGSSKPPSAERLIEEAPEGFMFGLRLPASVTHEPFEAAPGRTRRELGGGIEVVRSLRPVIDGLASAGRLAAVVAPFPNYFRPGPFERHYLESLRENVEGAPLAVELRSSEWAGAETEAWARSLDVAIVGADSPRDPALLPLWNVDTGSVRYFRFHGRNPHWFETNREERYDYLYSARELDELAAEVRSAAGSETPAFVVFNNCRAGQAFRNALQLAERLGLPVSPGTTPLKQPELFG